MTPKKLTGDAMAEMVAQLRDAIADAKKKLTIGMAGSNVRQPLDYMKLGLQATNDLDVADKVAEDMQTIIDQHNRRQGGS